MEEQKGVEPQTGLGMDALRKGDVIDMQPRAADDQAHDTGVGVYRHGRAEAQDQSETWRLSNLAPRSSCGKMGSVC